MAKFGSVPANQWHKPVKTDYKMGCCDCGLVHNVDFKVVNPKTGKEIKGAVVLIRLRRNERSTSAKRRHSGVKMNVSYEIDHKANQY